MLKGRMQVIGEGQCPMTKYQNESNSTEYMAKGTLY